MKATKLLKLIAADIKQAYHEEPWLCKTVIWLDFIAAALDFLTGNIIAGVVMATFGLFMLFNAVQSFHMKEATDYIDKLEKLVELWHQEADCRLSKIRELSMRVKQLEGETLAEEKKDVDESKEAEE